MKVSKQGREFVIVCDEVELDLLDNGLSVMVSEYDFGRPEPWIDLAKQMMTDIANMEMM